MFTNHFTDKQKSVFLDLLNKLVEADGNISPVERAKIDEYESLFAPIKPESVPNDALPDLFHAKRDKSSLMLELLGVGMIKNPDFSSNEHDDKFLRDLAKKLKISDYDLGWMTNWVAQLLFHLRHVEKVMTE
jgi:hypothetical protein